MLEKAYKLYRTGSAEDIKDFLPDLLVAYTQLDTQAIQSEKDYEVERIRLYTELKKEKKAKKNSYSDRDIDIISKLKAMEKYWDYMLNKRIANHYKMWMDMLSNQIININVMNKALREWNL